MYEIKEQFKNRSIGSNIIRINVNDDITVEIDTYDNSGMSYETFKLLVDNNYEFLFDFTKRIVKKNEV